MSSGYAPRYYRYSLSEAQTEPYVALDGAAHVARMKAPINLRR